MLFFRLIAKLPFSVFYFFSDLLFLVLFYIIRYRKNLVISNLEASFPEKTRQEIQQITRQFYRQFADYSLEILKLYGMSQEQIKERVKIENPELLKQFMAEGKYILAFGSHLANWEWIGPGLLANGVPSDAIYKPLSSPFFEKLVFNIRSRMGVRPVPMKQLMRDLVIRKNEPRLIGLATDQSPHEPQHALWMNFLNQDTGFFAGTEKLARSTGMPVVFGEFRRVKRGYYSAYFHLIDAQPNNQLPPQALTEQYRSLLEAAIRKNPADWLWSHNRWKHQNPNK